MRSSSSSSGGGGALSRLFSRRRRRRHRSGPSHAALVSGAALQQSETHRIGLLDSWGLSELFALRELVHLAINKNHIVAPDEPTTVAVQRTARGDEPTRPAASSSVSSNTTATSGTPPSTASVESFQRHQQLQSCVDAALTQSKRFYFGQRADTRLRLNGRRQFVRLFPLLGRTSKTVQRTLFRAFDADGSGKVEFEELCEMLAKVRQARASSVEAMAELVFSWFCEEQSKGEAVLMLTEMKLLAVAIRDLSGEIKKQEEQGVDLMASMMKLVLGRDETQVSKQSFCKEMDSELGAHVLHVLLAPFDIVRAMLDEESILQEMQNTRWKTGDTAVKEIIQAQVSNTLAIGRSRSEDRRWSRSTIFMRGLLVQDLSAIAIYVQMSSWEL
ncbi:hypothetical protein PHYBOEH_011641 [Phytophthora boehmeriae]|uniref:EF-hand domain-containing protein n=1 Tax=Phytophthora boehmeriae TaxID=109152 RepID=A0A8T1X6E4_9STRA|nr:hypothetical protein PHYBOEH_011641 [Phytophthora boehmeriae]